MGRKYNAIPLQYTRTTNVTVEKECNGFSMINRGNTKVILNGEPFGPNEVKQVGGNEGEIYVGRIDISFDATGVVPPLVNSCWITQKVYTDGGGYDNMTK